MKNETKLCGFSYSKNMANFEAFQWNISSSINLLFLRWRVIKHQRVPKTYPYFFTLALFKFSKKNRIRNWKLFTIFFNILEIWENFAKKIHNCKHPFVCMDKKNPLGNIGKFENQYTKGATSMQEWCVLHSRLKFDNGAISSVIIRIVAVWHLCQGGDILMPLQHLSNNSWFHLFL